MHTAALSSSLNAHLRVKNGLRSDRLNSAAIMTFTGDRGEGAALNKTQRLVFNVANQLHRHHSEKQARAALKLNRHMCVLI